MQLNFDELSSIKYKVEFLCPDCEGDRFESKDPYLLKKAMDIESINNNCGNTFALISRLPEESMPEESLNLTANEPKQTEYRTLKQRSFFIQAYHRRFAINYRNAIQYKTIRGYFDSLDKKE